MAPRLELLKHVEASSSVALLLIRHNMNSAEDSTRGNHPLPHPSGEAAKGELPCGSARLPRYIQGIGTGGVSMNFHCSSLDTY